jgi:PAS domain S-box-containing protein
MSIINPQLAALKERFVSGLPLRIGRMRGLLADLTQGGSPEAATALQRDAHSLVGAAGIHGLTDIAQAASELNRALIEHADIDKIQGLLAHLAEVVTTPSAPPDEESLNSGRITRQIVVAVEGQDERESSLVMFENIGLVVNGISSAIELEKNCRNNSAPDLVFLGMQFGSDAQAGLGLLTTVKKYWPDAPCILTMSSRSVEIQLLAYHLGATHVLTKPFEADTLKQLALLLLDERNLAPNVLVLGKLNPDLSAQLKQWEQFASLDTLLNRVEKGPADAVVVCHGEDSDRMDELTRLIVDHPGTTNLPVLWLNQNQKKDLWLHATVLGAVATLETHLSAENMVEIVSAHVKRARAFARRSRQLQSLMYEVNRQRLALDHHTIVSLANAQGEIIETSANHVHLTGYTLEQLLGSHLTEARAGKAPPELPAMAWTRVTNGDVWQGQVSIRRQDGELRWLETTLVPFLTPQGKPYQFLLARTDISARIESEAALSLARQSEMQTASIIQKTLLVPPLPPSVGGAAVAAQFRASSGLAGDFHELIDLGNQCFDVILGDVMGKGMGAALIAAGLKLELSRCFSEVAQAHPNVRPDPAQIVRALNSKITPKLIELGSFATMSYLRCDLKNQTLISIGCGHPETILMTGELTESIPNLNLPIGILEDEPYLQSTHPLPPGTTLVLYSDGLSEAVNAQNEEFGAERIQAAVREPHLQNLGARTSALAIMENLHTYTAVQPQKDDQTLIVIRTPRSAEKHLHFPRSLNALPVLRNKISAFAVETSVNELDLDAIHLTCTEVFSNIVKHATTSNDDKDIVVALMRTTSGLDVEFTDLSQAFLPTNTPQIPEVEQLALGGYGLGLIEILSESVHYAHYHGVNHCKLSLNCLNSTISGATSATVDQ